MNFSGLLETDKLHHWSVKNDINQKKPLMQYKRLFSQAKIDWERPLYKMKHVSVDALTLHHLSNILDLLSQITSYFTLQSLKKHHFKQGHMEKCTSITSEGLAFSCKGFSPKWLMCLERSSIWSYGNGEEQGKGWNV